jgi:hypothetical protein
MNLWKHADKWDAPPAEEAVTLGEGGTPLVRSRVIGPALGVKNLWFKVEGGNPTGSYKDRFAAAAEAAAATGRPLLPWHGPNSIIPPSNMYLLFSSSPAKFSIAAFILVGLALYASSMILFVPFVTN